MLEAKDGPHHMARVVARMVGSLSYLMAFPVDLFSQSSISLNNYVAKSLSPLTPRRSLEVKNMQKQGNMLRCVKTK
jgi:hypothetical protein